MNFYQFSGLVLRCALATILLVSAAVYIHESTFDSKLVNIVKVIEGQYSVQIDNIDLKLALNDSTFMLKIEA